MKLAEILSGLPEDLSLCGGLAVIIYLFLLVLVDSLSGWYLTHYADATGCFTLIRSGWKGWYLRVAAKAAGFSAILCLGIGCITLAAAPQAKTLAAWGVFSLNMLLWTAVQTVMIAVLKNSAVSLVAVVFVQLCSVFFSSHLPGNWKLCLPGNWGSLCRSACRTADGFSLAAALAIEIGLCAILWIFGWKFARKINQMR